MQRRRLREVNAQLYQFYRHVFGRFVKVIRGHGIWSLAPLSALPLSLALKHLRSILPARAWFKTWTPKTFLLASASILCLGWKN